MDEFGIHRTLTPGLPDDRETRPTSGFTGFMSESWTRVAYSERHLIYSFWCVTVSACLFTSLTHKTHDSLSTSIARCTCHNSTRISRMVILCRFIHTVIWNPSQFATRTQIIASTKSISYYCRPPVDPIKLAHDSFSRRIHAKHRVSTAITAADNEFSKR